MERPIAITVQSRWQQLEVEFDKIHSDPKAKPVFQYLYAIVYSLVCAGNGLFVYSESRELRQRHAKRAAASILSALRRPELSALSAAVDADAREEHSARVESGDIAAPNEDEPATFHFGAPSSSEPHAERPKRAPVPARAAAVPAAAMPQPTAEERDLLLLEFVSSCQPR